MKITVGFVFSGLEYTLRLLGDHSIALQLNSLVVHVCTCTDSEKLGVKNSL